jgi:hypothetical protein
MVFGLVWFLPEPGAYISQVHFTHHHTALNTVIVLSCLSVSVCPLYVYCTYHVEHSRLHSIPILYIPTQSGTLQIEIPISPLSLAIAFSPAIEGSMARPIGHQAIKPLINQSSNQDSQHLLHPSHDHDPSLKSKHAHLQLTQSTSIDTHTATRQAPMGIES